MASTKAKLGTSSNYKAAASSAATHSQPGGDVKPNMAANSAMGAKKYGQGKSGSAKGK